MRSPLLLFLYALSGAAALLYEVLWLRMLTLSMGNTTGAVGILLAAFMGGLAMGAWRAGPVAERLTPRAALRAYAALEAAIAAAALLLPLALGLMLPALAWAYADGNGGRLFDLVRGALAFVLLTLPAAAMGATYPIAIRWFGGSLEGAEGQPRGAAAPHRRAGGLYAANTAGAAVGAAAGGFLLLPMLGARGATAVGVALNLTAAAGALALAARVAREEAFAEPDTHRAARHGGETERRGARSRRAAAATAAAVPEPSAGVRLRIAAGALGVSGFVALTYQVAWTRIAGMVLGPTTYAFSSMLVAVITGLAVGSAIAAARAPRSGRAAIWLGGVLTAAAAAALLACFAIDRVPLFMAALVSGADVTFETVLVTQIALAIALQLPMTIALGAAFPLALAVAASDGAALPRQASVVYATNTAGAIAGALTASFLLIPSMGIQASVRLAAVLATLTGMLVAWRGGGRAVGTALAGAAALVLAAAMPPWNQERLANGGYRYASALAAGDLEAGLEAGQLLYYREGAAGTVSVRQVPGARSLAIDGKVDASNASDMLTQKLLAHLPLLLHPDPRRVCVIGLGSGVTLAAALAHPVERADVVEISPEVVAAAAFFAAEHKGALDDPRTRLILGDGRSHLRLGRADYDVIISEPSNPWMAGIAALFTREFFEAARARLAPGGLLTQWAHTYNITDDDLRSIVATFLSVFPHGTAWLVSDSDLLLVGGVEPIAALRDGIDAAWERPGVAADLAEVSVRDLFSVLTLHVAGGEGLRRYAGDAAIQSDDRLALEYSAPRAIYGRFQQENVDALRALARAAPQPPAVRNAAGEAGPAALKHRGLMLLEAGAAGLALADLRRASAAAPDAESLHGLARAAAQSGRLEEAERQLADIGASGSVPALVELSVVRAALGRADAATEAARQAVVADPRNRRAIVQLASMYAQRQDAAALEQLRAVAEQVGEQDGADYASMWGAYLQGDFARAVQLSEALAGRGSNEVTVWTLQASAHAALGHPDRARAALEEALRLTPTDPGIFVNLGQLALREGDAGVAAERFSEAVYLAPANVAALEGLADALERQGRRGRAAAIRARIAG